MLIWTLGILVKEWRITERTDIDGAVCPNEEPAIAAFEDINGTAIYVSWNGDTETDRWRFYEHFQEANSTFLLGEVVRKSFETVHRVWNRKPRIVFAEAVDREENVLRSTRIATIEPAVYQATVDSMKNWRLLDASMDQQPLA